LPDPTHPAALCHGMAWKCMKVGAHRASPSYGARHAIPVCPVISTETALHRWRAIVVLSIRRRWSASTTHRRGH